MIGVPVTRLLEKEEPVQKVETPLTTKVRRALVKRAGERDVITYGALAAKVRVRNPLNLNNMLNRIHENDLAEDRPSLATLVVGQDLGKRMAWKSWTEKEWHKEQTRVYQHYAR